MDACKKWLNQFKPSLIFEEVDLSANEKINAYEKNIAEYLEEIEPLKQQRGTHDTD